MIVTSARFAAPSRAVGNWSRTRPTWLGTSVSSSSTRGESGGRIVSPLRGVPCRSRSAPSPFFFCRWRRRSRPSSPVRPAAGVRRLLDDPAVRFGAFFFGDVGRGRGRGSAAPTSTLGADQHRHLDQLRPARDEERHGRPLGRGRAAGGFRADHDPFFDRVGVVPFDRRSKPAASAFHRLCLARSPRPRDLGAARPALTVRVTFGFEQKKVRKEQSTAACRGGEAAGSCSSTVVGGRVRSTRFTSPTLKPFCWSRAMATLSWLPVTPGTWVVVSRVRTKPTRRPIRTAATRSLPSLPVASRSSSTPPPARRRRRQRREGGGVSGVAGVSWAASRAAMNASASGSGGRAPSPAPASPPRPAPVRPRVDRAGPLRRLGDLFHRDRHRASPSKGTRRVSAS